MILFLQEGNAAHLIPTPGAAGAEELIINAVLWVKLVIELIGSIIICLGVAFTVIKFARSLVRPHLSDYNEIRLTLARFLALALEFQLGADILSTAVAPSWEQIGKLGAIAIIRTALNYFLTREMSSEHADVRPGPPPIAATRGVEPEGAAGAHRVS